MFVFSIEWLNLDKALIFQVALIENVVCKKTKHFLLAIQNKMGVVEFAKAQGLVNFTNSRQYVYHFLFLHLI